MNRSLQIIKQVIIVKIGPMAVHRSRAPSVRMHWQRIGGEPVYLLAGVTDEGGDEPV